MRLSFKATLFAALFVFTACESEDFSPAIEKTAEIDVLAPENGVQLLRLVNQLRKKGCRCGNNNMPPAAPLTWNADLEDAALRHAHDMQTNDFFNHTGRDGSDVSRRVTETGYNWQSVGENIAWGYQDAESVFRGWRDSPGHCRNMMNTDFQHMGSARVADYWVQVFARPRSN